MAGPIAKLFEDAIKNEKKKPVVAQVTAQPDWKQIGATRNARKVTGGVDPALTIVKKAEQYAKDNPNFLNPYIPNQADELAKRKQSYYHAPEADDWKITSFAKRLANEQQAVRTMDTSPFEVSTGSKIADTAADFLGFGLGLIGPGSKEGGALTSAAGGALKGADYALRPVAKQMTKLAETGAIGKATSRGLHGMVAGGAYGAAGGLTQGMGSRDTTINALENALLFGGMEAGFSGLGTAAKGIKISTQQLPRPVDQDLSFIPGSEKWGAGKETEVNPEYRIISKPKPLLALPEGTGETYSNIPNWEYWKPYEPAPVDFTADSFGNVRKGESLKALPFKELPKALPVHRPLALPTHELQALPPGFRRGKQPIKETTKANELWYVNPKGGAGSNTVYLNDISKKYNQMVSDEVRAMKDSLGGVATVKPEGAEQLFRVSQNPSWYREFYASNGRPPKEGEYRDLAIKNLIEGNPETGEPANEEFLSILSELSRGQKLPEEWHGLQKSIRELEGSSDSIIEPSISDEATLLSSKFNDYAKESDAEIKNEIEYRGYNKTRETYCKDFLAQNGKDFIGTEQELNEAKSMFDKKFGTQQSSTEGVDSLITDMKAEQAKVEPFGLTRDLGRLTETENMRRSRMVDKADFSQYGDVRFKKEAPPEIQAQLDAATKEFGWKKKYAPDAMKSERFQAANELSKALTGRDVITYTSNEGEQGFAMGRQVFLNARSKHPMLYVASHEITHTMETSHPEHYSRLKDIVVEHVADDASIFNHYVKKYKYDPKEVPDELTADILAECMVQKSFWERVRDKAPELLKPILDSIDRILSVAKKQADVPGKYQMMQHMKDVEVMRDRLAEVYRNYMRDSQGEQAFVEQFGSKWQDSAAKTKAETGSAKPLNKRISGDKLLDAEDLILELKENGGMVDDNGYVTLYHRTDKSSAEKIWSTGKMTAKEDGLFFSTKADGQATGYGDTVMEFKIPVEKLVLDDVFGNEAHLRIPLNNRNQVADVRNYMRDSQGEQAFVEQFGSKWQDSAAKAKGEKVETSNLHRPFSDDMIHERESDLINRYSVEIDNHAKNSREEMSVNEARKLIQDSLWQLEQDSRGTFQAAGGKLSQGGLWDSANARGLKQALPEGKSRRRLDDGTRIIGNGIVRDFVQNGRVDLRVQVVKNAEDMATLAQVYRNPKFETFRIIYTKGDKIVGHEGMTSRLPGQASLLGPNETHARLIYDIKNRINRMGADGYYLLHNHPSGHSKPSQQDVNATGFFYNEVPGCKGHIVINSNEYSIIEPSAVGWTMDVKTLSKQFGEDLLLKPSQPHGLLGKQILSPGDVVDIAENLKDQSDKAIVIYRASNGEVRAIQEVPIGIFNTVKGATDYIRGRALDFGSREAFVVTYDPKNNKNIDKMVGDGVLLDAIFYDKNVSQPMQPGNNLGGQSANDKWMGINAHKVKYRVNEDSPNIRYKLDQKNPLDDVKAMVEYGATQLTRNRGQFAKALQGRFPEAFAGYDKETADRLAAYVFERSNEYRRGGTTLRYPGGEVEVKRGEQAKPEKQESPAHKDISGFQADTQDVSRNFRDFYGEDVELQEGSILDSFNRSKGQKVDYENQWLEKLKEVTEGMGIKKDSKLSAAVQKYGEGKTATGDSYTYKELVDEVGLDNAVKVVEAENWFRTAYDQIIEDVNRVVKEIYPNNPDKLVPKRKDYFRHFQEMGGLEGVKNLLGSPATISPELAGKSDFTLPKTKWASFKQRRGLGEYKEDAVGGFLNYLPAASYSIHIDPHISKFEGLADDLAKATEESRDANNFIEYLRDYSRDLAGKTNAWDRKTQKVIGRKAMGFLTWLNNRAKKNAVMMNLGSALSQPLNIPNGVAFAKQHAVKGTGRAITNIFREDPARNKSIFMKERYGLAKNYRQFEASMLNKPEQFASWLLETSDRIGTEIIWQSCYEKGLNTKGVADPVIYADVNTKRLVAGRGIGERALIQKSKLFQIAAPFQVEVGNLWKVQRDFVKEKDFAGLATLMVGLWMANNVSEAARGQRIVFDPIDAVIKAVDDWQKDTESGTGRKIVKTAGRLGGEFLSNIPLGQTAAALYPEYGFEVAETKAPTRKEMFGDSDPTRYGTGPLIAKAVTDPGKYLLLPFGGAQVDKTVNAIGSLAKGGSYKDDKLRYPVSNDPINATKGVLFGPSGFRETPDYYRNNRRPLSENQTGQVQSGQTSYQTIMDLREGKLPKAKKSSRNIKPNLKPNLRPKFD